MAEKTEKKTTAEKLSELRTEAMKTCAQEIDAVLLKHACVLAAIPGLVPDGNGGWRIMTKIEVQSKQ